VQADIRSFALDEQFDAVICLNGALHYIQEPQDTVRALRRAKDHLRPGGSLIVELRDRMRLPESPPTNGNGNAWSSWLPRHRQEDSDHFALSGIETSSGRHVLDVRNFFHTDPFRIANWARMVGLDSIRLYADYSLDENYRRSAGDGKVVLVACRPDPAHVVGADALSGGAATSG
jgi:SAM-dependent methyltransferase